jgi:alginate O-acetyltransferase complex protein AlgI
MVFSSLLFLAVFLPTFLALYYASGAIDHGLGRLTHRAPGTTLRNGVALVGSYFFYAWGAPRFVLVLLLSSAMDYVLSRLIDRVPPERPRRRRFWLIVALGLNLSLLACFKYANFFVAQLNDLLVQLGGQPLAWSHIPLPIGISFFTFQEMTYLVDVYRRVVPPARSFRSYALYVALFPQLVAGPIVRYHDVAMQLWQRTHPMEKIFSGIWRFCLGLGKKVLVANALGAAANRVFAADPATLPTTAAWVGVLCFAFQIYFDFSGYSDMAIGLGRMMGFEFLENFNCPYIAASFTEFWRRWHISLSNFMREYLYIPLGGNRVPRYRMFLNLWIVFLLCGLWHGANWTFVAWGAYHGLFLSLEKLLAGRTAWRLPRVLAVPLTFLLVTAGWVFFRYGLPEQRFAEVAEYSEQTVSDSAAYLARLADVPSIFRSGGDVTWYFGQSGGVAAVFRAQGELRWRPLLGNREFVILVVAALISFLPAGISHFRFQISDFRLADRANPESQIPNPKSQIGTCLLLWAKFAVAMSLLVLSTCSLVNLHFNPFLYFRF